MLKISRNTKSLIRPGKDGVEVGSDNRARRDGNKLDRSEINGVEVDSGEFGDNKIRKEIEKTFKFKNLFKSTKLSKSKEIVRSDFLPPKLG